MAGGPLGMHTYGSDLLEALERWNVDGIQKFWMKTPTGLFGGGRDLRMDKFPGGQLVYKWEITEPVQSANIGAVTGDTVFPTYVGGQRFDNVMYKRAHLNNLTASMVWDSDLKRMLKSASSYEAGLKGLMERLLTTVTENFHRGVDISSVTDRRNILGTVVRLTNMDGNILETPAGNTDPDDETIATGYDPETAAAYAGCYKFIMELGVDAVWPAFKIGASFSIVDAPTNYASSSETGAACGNVRNYGLAGDSGAVHSPIRVTGITVRQAYDSNGAVYKVPCSVFYTDDTHKAAVLAMIIALVSTVGAVGTGDVVTEYCDNLAATDTTKTRGANFGRQGLLHWFTRANIQTATGACSTALTDTEGNTISRASTGNASIWYPYVSAPSTYNTTQITLAVASAVANQVAFQNGGVLSPIPVANSLVVQTLADEVADGSYRQSMPTWDARGKERWQASGFRGVTLQSVGVAPFDIGVQEWLPPWGVYFLDPSDYSYIAPCEAEFETNGTGSIWHDRHNTSAKTKFSSECVMIQPFQMHARTMWLQGGAHYYRP